MSFLTNAKCMDVNAPFDFDINVLHVSIVNTYSSACQQVETEMK